MNLAGHLLTADPTEVRGKAKWLPSRSVARTAFSGKTENLQLVLSPEPLPNEWVGQESEEPA